ncbi:hypothetical protein BD413DRAFT_472444 [Trametes elegans]|nr:hypothetical protein BD413DRAFT_472444 [Trametes elegans]
MSTASPTAFLLWAILSVLFLVFLVHHLWCYDKFKCLRWSAGRQPGAFKRVMTYSYLGAVPLFAFYSIGMTVIKYREGLSPPPTLFPRPINMYREENRTWVLPLQFVFTIAWALELVTHLEELAFWLYLLHQNPNKEAWFSSWEYRLWYIGSLFALIGLPMTALITRNHLDTVDAYIFLVGSAGSTSTTVSFLYVLWRFPRFIRHVKAEGADPSVVVRLATFFQLNEVRVVFRFLFTLPLLVLALDGIIGRTHPVNHNQFLTDLFFMFGGIGCFVSSMITLLIFFPRSIVREAGYKPKLASAASFSSSAPASPKSPVSPSAPFAPRAHAQAQQRYSAHARGSYPVHVSVAPVLRPPAATPTLTESAMTGATGMTGAATWELDESAYTASVYSPRDSPYDSPQYTAEDGFGFGFGVGVGGEGGGGAGVQRRASRRRASAHHGAMAMDVHPERDSDADDEGEGEGEGECGAGAAEDRDEEESAPPYSHTAQPAEAHLHQRHPFPHSLSSPQIRAMPLHDQGARAEPRTPSSSPPPRPGPGPGAGAGAQGARPTSPSSKRRTWGWEEARHASFALAAPAPVPGSAALGGVGLGVNVNLGAGAGVGRHARRVSSLHPYVVNFTSPIDLVDISPLGELPRSM